jgi:hypothetical protein
MARRKKVQEQEEVQMSTVHVNFLKVGAFVAMNDGQFLEVVRIDPVLDMNHPNLSSNEAVIYLDKDGKVVPTLFRGDLKVKAA